MSALATPPIAAARRITLVDALATPQNGIQNAIPTPHALTTFEVPKPTPAVDAFAAATTPEAIAATQAEVARALDGRFDVLGLIAIGGMANIFELRHTVHGGRFVAKVMHRHLARRTELVDAFYREARHAAQLAGHPSVTPVFDLAAADGLLYLLMPFVDGEDLDHILTRRGKLPREEALGLTAQMASVLMYAETLGIVHGDLAPGNIRLDRFGQYKLLDFGLSFSTAEPAPRTYTAGTPAYNSPEQLKGELPDIRSDLYSLGCILFETLAGRPMFEAPNLDDLAKKHLAGSWTTTPEIEADPAISALVRMLVTRNRDYRLPSAFELSGALAAMGFELPSFYRALTSEDEQAPRSRRRRLQ